MLPGWQSGLFLQNEIRARKSRNGLLKAVRRMTQDLPTGLREDVKAFCDILDQRSRYRHRAVHGAWFDEPGRLGVMNLYFSEGPDGHLEPEPMHIPQEELDEAIADIQGLLDTAHALRDRIRALREADDPVTSAG